MRLVVWFVIDHSLVLVFDNCIQISIEFAYRISDTSAECCINLFSDSFDECHFYEFERTLEAYIQSSAAAAARVRFYHFALPIKVFI